MNKRIPVRENGAVGSASRSWSGETKTNDSERTNISLVIWRVLRLKHSFGLAGIFAQNDRHSRGYWHGLSSVGTSCEETVLRWWTVLIYRDTQIIFNISLSLMRLLARIVQCGDQL
ncbi:hypothetical protein J6590_030919 [Homalodisca vitripennis]|nr:hypothetical protein J6590_030919 [Homalodisca vitripennis]